MFNGILRSTLPSLRSIPSTLPANGHGVAHQGFNGFFGFVRGALARGMESPLLLGGERGISGKACLKTNKSAAKRFIVRGGGRVKRGKGGRSHNTGHKGRKRVNNLAASAPISEKNIEERMRRLIRA